MNYLTFFKNKTVLIITSITVVIFVLVLILSPKKSTNTTSPNSELDTTTTRPELIDLHVAKRQEAAAYVNSIRNKLPIYFENFETSVGLTTTINLYRLDDDPEEILRLEIYGLSYLNQESNQQKNPNAQAFKESYLKAIELLESHNIDPKKLIFIYGDKEYVRTTSQVWIDDLNLRP